MTASLLTEWCGMGSRQGQTMQELLLLAALHNNTTTNADRNVQYVDVGYLAEVAANHVSDSNKNVWQYHNR